MCEPSEAESFDEGGFWWLKMAVFAIPECWLCLCARAAGTVETVGMDSYSSAEESGRLPNRGMSNQLVGSRGRERNQSAGVGRREGSTNSRYRRHWTFLCGSRGKQAVQECIPAYIMTVSWLPNNVTREGRIFGVLMFTPCEFL